MESELFGYEKGAFSGANASKPGLFELANHGTLFLDEIGDVDLRLQAKLLRVLDGAPYYRLGGVRKVSVDVRLITATNQELTSAVAQGRFRSDLYHRLSQLKLSVPPLRERLDDIIPLAHHYLEQQQPGMGIAREAEERLRSYSWPGNVRELRNVILRASIFASGTEITVAELPEEFAHACVSQSLEKLATLDQLERRSIIEAMSECGGHQGRTASTLGISVRTLQRKLKSYGMSKGAEEESS
jgi:DNA-binding NtrC family response regulator